MSAELEPKIVRNKNEVKTLKKLIKEILLHDTMQDKRKKRKQAVDAYQIRLF